MIFQNPVVRGFSPDPSVCQANGKYYLVTSTFQYFPGIPVYESEDLVNWELISHVLTRRSQVELDGIRSSGGVFAPTIRFHEGRFYVVTNNNSTNRNFYVYTDDIRGAWSEPVEVDQDGIDPSLLFDEGHVYFISNGTDEETGRGAIFQCEIDIATGRKLTESRKLWAGSGGRYLESPHMYHIGAYYYLMAAEGGTEYGHMVTYARGNSPWGPFEAYSCNPVLTNRNKAPYEIQGVGHGDLVEGADGNWYMLCLGFRQIGIWQPFHHLGRETFLCPITFDASGWFTAGNDGTMDAEYEIPGSFEQKLKQEYTMADIHQAGAWLYLRHPNPSDYQVWDELITLRGTDVTLDDVGSPTFLGVRQTEFAMEVSADFVIEPENERGLNQDKRILPESGMVAYMSEHEHYEVAIRYDPQKEEYAVLLRLNVGDIKHIQAIYSPLSGREARLTIRADAQRYVFCLTENGKTIELGSAQTKYLSSEVSEGFTGVVLGLYAQGAVKASISDFVMKNV